MSSARRTRWLRPVTLAVVGALAAVVPACSSADSGGPTQGTLATPGTDDPSLTVVRGGVLKVGLSGETASWNPTSATWALAGTDVSFAIFDRLAAYDTDDVPRPDLAEAIDPDPDFRRWTIRLRDGVRFHDGTPLDAEAVRTNLLASKSSLTVSSALASMQAGDGAVQVVDRLTLTVAMSEPWSTFADVLASQVGAMASPAMLADPEGYGKPVGTGPFTFTTWTPDSKLVVTRNGDYWRKGPDGASLPYLDGIEFRQVGGGPSAIASLRAGDIDVLEADDPTVMATFLDPAEAGRFSAISDAANPAPMFTLLNTIAPPFDDPLARSALVHATDRDLLARTISSALRPADGMFPPESPWRTETSYPDHDPARAATELEAYAAAHGGPLTFTLSYSAGGSTTGVEALQQQWRALGIAVELEPVEQTAFILQIVTGKYQSAMWSLPASPTPDSNHPFWLGANAKGVGEIALNVSRFHTPAIDEAMSAARRTSDRAEQRAQYAIVQRELATGEPYVWLHWNPVGLVADRSVHALTTFRLPDGQAGRPLTFGVAHPWWQVWRTPST